MHAARVIGVVVTVVVLLVVVSVTARAIPTPGSAPTTSFSLGPSYAKAPEALPVRAGQRVVIPVVGQTKGNKPQSYRLTTTVDGRMTSRREVRLRGTGTWSGTVDVTAPAGSQLHRVTIALRSVAGGRRYVLTVDLSDHAT